MGVFLRTIESNDRLTWKDIDLKEHLETFGIESYDGSISDIIKLENKCLACILDLSNFLIRRACLKSGGPLEFSVRS